MRLRYAALSDVGRVRSDNQDSGYAGPHLLVIADGVGGSARGDVASAATVEVLRKLDDPRAGQATCSAAWPAPSTAATTGSPAWSRRTPRSRAPAPPSRPSIFDGTHIGVGHVGDSRGYLLRDGTLSQLTTDHTFVQSLIDEGRITEDEARVHPHRNLILRAVDGVHEPEPDVFTLEVAAGDRILLCSDGCSGVLSDDELARILGEGTPDHAAVSLISASLDAGSSDNVTVVVADVVDDDAVDDADTTASAATGPMIVGAGRRGAAPRGLGGAARRTRRRHRRARADRGRGGLRRTSTPRRCATPRAHRAGSPGLRRIAVLARDPPAGRDRRHRRLEVEPEPVLRRQRRRRRGDLPGRRGRRARHQHPPRRGDQRPQAGRPAGLQRSGRSRDGISASSLDDARGIVSRLQRLVPVPGADPDAEPQRQPHEAGASQHRQAHEEAPPRARPASTSASPSPVAPPPRPAGLCTEAP